MRLSDLVISVAYKELVHVDLPGGGSNQHEINGVASLREFFISADRTVIPIKWSYFRDDKEVIHEAGSVTFYDARENHPTRTEWRLYYTGNFLSCANSGDVVILLRVRGESNLQGLVFEQASSFLRAASTLFKLSGSEYGRKFSIISEETLRKNEIGLLEQYILEDIDINISAIACSVSDEDLVKETFNNILPSTREMSEFARTQIKVDFSNPDQVLVRWIQRETEIFNAIQKNQMQERIQRGFETPDDFIQYCSSVTNTRKSRMGLSFENHIEELLNRHDLRFDRNKITERTSKPDFIFPGIEEYHNTLFSDRLLTMLAAKSTCKERWRQILTEADRIATKNLCTLDTTITENQTDEMERQNLKLVIPSEFHTAYSDTQQDKILTMGDFINLVEMRQSSAGR